MQIEIGSNLVESPARFHSKLRGHVASVARVHRPCATAVGCIEADVASPVRTYLRREFGIHSLDPVRFSGPLVSLAGRGDPEVARWARERVRASWLRNGSSLIAVVAHAGCSRSLGTPVEQIEGLSESVERIATWNLGVEAVGLWIDETGAVDWLA